MRDPETGYKYKDSLAPYKADDSRLVDTDLTEFLVNKFTMNRVFNGLSTHGQEIRVEKDKDIKVIDITEELLVSIGEKPVTTCLGSWMTLIESENVFVKIRFSSNSIHFDILGDKNKTKELMECYKESLDVVAMTVEWVTNMDMNTVSIPLIEPRGITDSSYPFIAEGVDNFVDSFLSSTENVLVLIGPPGTGKSNLIQYIIARSKRNAMITYDPAIMNKDDIFANFIESDCGSFIMEDADAFLASRLEGNTSMHKFLNVSSGIVSMSGKKLIFSTNLESSEQIDPALLRPGRCFGLIQFRKLDKTEAQKFLDDHKTDIKAEGSYTLAELYNMSGRDRKQKKRSIGFTA